MKYKITLNDRTYEVEVEAGKAMLLDEYETIAPAAPVAPVVATPVVASAPVAAPTAPPAAPVATGGGEAVEAPMPGSVLQVNVTVGQAVKEGDVLVVLEAMKMENEIKSPKSGTVTQIVATKGATVETGAVLVVLG